MPQSTTSTWPAGWVRAALPTAILACLEAGPQHGYAVAQSLAARGFGQPRGGSLYPALAKLAEAGAVQTAWVEGAAGPGRRQYTLTPKGRERLAAERQGWQELVQALGPGPSVGGRAAALGAGSGAQDRG